MGVALNDLCRSALRPFFIAALAALAWLIWTAGSANAALPAPDPVPQLEQANTSTFEEASATATPPVISPVVALIDVAPPLIAIADSKSPPTPSVPLPAPPDPAPTELPAMTVLPVTDSITGPATTVTTTLTKTANAIPTVEAGLGDAAGVVGGAAGAILPDAVLPVAGALFPGEEGPKAGPGGEAPGGQLSAEAGAANAELAAASQDWSIGGFGIGQSRLIPPAFRTLAAMGDSGVSPPVAGPPGPGERQLTAGPGSASTGSGGGGVQAWADMAGFWAVLLARGAGIAAFHQLPPAVPSFDPGSSPD